MSFLVCRTAKLILSVAAWAKLPHQFFRVPLLPDSPEGAQNIEYALSPKRPSTSCPHKAVS